MPLRYRLAFTEVGQRLEVTDEVIENKRAYEGMKDVYFYYRFLNGHPVLNVQKQMNAQELQETKDKFGIDTLPEKFDYFSRHLKRYFPPSW